VHFPNLVLLARVVQNALGHGGLTRINVGDYSDITGILLSVFSRHTLRLSRKVGNNLPRTGAKRLVRGANVSRVFLAIFSGHTLRNTKRDTKLRITN
jgi:hypothetical protein